MNDKIIKDLEIDYTKSGMEITAQASKVAKFYQTGLITQDQAIKILTPYFDWFHKKAKKINPRAKKPSFAYFVRSIAGMY